MGEEEEAPWRQSEERQRPLGVRGNEERQRPKLVRGNRSFSGHQHDEAMKAAKQAEKWGFASITDRWDNCDGTKYTSNIAYADVMENNEKGYDRGWCVQADEHVIRHRQSKEDGERNYGDADR